MGLSGFSHSSNGNDPLTWGATGQPRFFPGLVLPPALGLNQKVPGIGCPERELEARHCAGSIFLSSREGDQKAQPHPRPMRIREGKEGTGGRRGPSDSGKTYRSSLQASPSCGTSSSRWRGGCDTGPHSLSCKGGTEGEGREGKMRLNQGGCDNSEGPGVGQRGRQRIPLLVLGWAVELPPRVGSPLQLSSERPLSPPPKANSTWHFASPLEPAPRPTAEKKKQDEG